MPRHNRPVDIGPKCYVHSSYVIRRPSEATGFTQEFVSGRPISLRDVPARRASPGCVSRINQDQRHTGDSRFVCQELPELIEAPSMQVATLSLSNHNPGSNAIEIFNGNSSKGVFGFRNKLLRDTMVCVLSKPGGLLGKLLKMPLCRFGSLGLKPRLQGICSLSNLVELLSCVYLTVGIDSKILDTNIHAKNALGFVLRFFGDLNDHAKVEDTVDEDQISLTTNPIKSRPLVVSDHNRHNLPSLKSDYGYGLKPLPRKNSLIVDDSPIGTELWLDRLIAFIGFDDLGNGTYGKLCGKSVLSANIVVDRVMHFNLVSFAHLKNSISYLIAGLIKSVHGIKKHPILLFSWIELNHQSLKHHIDIKVHGIYMYLITGRGTLLPGLKTGVSATPAPRRIL